MAIQWFWEALAHSSIATVHVASYVDRAWSTNINLDESLTSLNWPTEARKDLMGPTKGKGYGAPQPVPTYVYA